MPTNTYIDPIYDSPLHEEVRQWILDHIDTIDDGCEYQKVPSIRMTDEMKQEQRLLHLGKKRSKEACKRMSEAQSLGNHNLAKSYLLISPTGEEIFVPKGEMNIVAPKYNLDPNVLRLNATKIRKNGTPFKHKKWITQLVC